MEKDTQIRKWLVTINNPSEHGFPQEQIKEQIFKFKSLVYCCMSDEVGEQGTYHTHIYLAFRSSVRFSTLKQRFPPARIDPANGTSQQNRDYIFKEGVHASGKKADTNLRDTHYEYGDMPVERQGFRNDLADLYDMIKQGVTDSEILEECPQYLFNMEKIERARQIVRQNEFKDRFRILDVTYVYGETGTGKTRDIMEKHGYSSVYRVTDYEHPFDGYKGQSVVVFEEYRNDLKIGDMLNYLDGYPLELPCRYANKTACFDTVYVVSNISLNDQYPNIQEFQNSTWDAFLRRFNRVKHYTIFGVDTYSVADYMNRFEVIQEDLGIFKQGGIVNV